MKGSSKAIMGATIAIIIVLGIVLALVLILLAQLYYTLLFRKPKLNKLSQPSSLVQDPQIHSFPSPLTTFYAQGVLHPPTNFLFLKGNDDDDDNKNNDDDDIEKQKHGKLHQFLRVQNHHQIGVTSLSSSSPSPCYMSMTEPNQPSHNHDQVQSDGCEFMYISNPIYDNHEGALGPSSAVVGSSSCPGSLPLSPIVELGEKSGGSVGSRDVMRSIGTSNSECNSRNGHSSSSSARPTSPSW